MVEKTEVLSGALGTDVPAGDMYPRVLVVHQFPFNTRDGGGLRMMNYFRDWPSDRVAQIYGPRGDITAEMEEHRDTTICRNYYMLSDAEYRRRWFMRAFYARRACRQQAGADRPEFSSPTSAAPANGGRLKQELRALGLTQPVVVKPRPEMWRFVEDFRPDIIFSVLGTLGWTRLVSDIATRTGASPILFLNDDWMSDQFEKGPYAAFMRSVLRRELSALAQRSGLRYAVSELMAENFKGRFGASFDVLEPTVELDQWRCKSALSDRTGDERILLYAGTVFANAQLTGLQDIAKSVDRLNALGNRLRLVIATTEECRRDIAGAFKSESTTLIEYKGREDVMRLTESADVLLLPINFDDASLRFVRYSKPGKMAAYLASGRPMLVYGPPGVPPTEETARHGYGFVLSERSASRLDEILLKAVTDEKLREVTVERALAYAREHHDIETVLVSLRQAMASTVQQGTAQ